MWKQHFNGRVETDDGDITGISITPAGPGAGNSSCDGNTIENNTLYNIGRNVYNVAARGKLSNLGILVESSNGNTIRFNRLYDIWRSGINLLTQYNDSKNNLIYGNLIYNIGKISETVAYNKSGIYMVNKVGALDGTRVFNNTITGSYFTSSNQKEGAISLKVHGAATGASNRGSLDGLQVVNNILAFNTGNSALSVDIEADAKFLNAVFNNNIYFNTSGTAIQWNDASGVKLYDFEHVKGNRSGYYTFDKGQDSNSIVGEPKFSNPAVGDYTLMNSSPAVNAGLNMGQTRDIAGNAVPFDALYDIGCYENTTPIPPVITGVAEGRSYKTAVRPEFPLGTGLLSKNGASPVAFVSGSEISDEGNYILTVTKEAGNSAAISFNIDKTPPTVTGITQTGTAVVDGGVYEEDVSFTFTEGTASLSRNGEAAAAYFPGTPISEEGVYQLTVTDAADNAQTVSFTISGAGVTVSGVVYNGLYNTPVTPIFNEGVATLSRNEGLPQNFISNSEVSDEGSYVLSVRKSVYAVKSFVVPFTIDLTPPTVSGVVYGGIYSTDVAPVFFDINGIASATLAMDGALPVNYTSGDNITEQGKYVLVITDNAGNGVDIKFSIRKSEIVITGVEDGKVYKINVKPVFTTATAVYSRNDAPPVQLTAGTVLSQEGKYVLTATDRFGVSKVVTFFIDKTSPAISGVDNGGTYSIPVMPVFNEGTGVLRRSIWPDEELNYTDHYKTSSDREDLNTQGAIEIMESGDAVLESGPIAPVEVKVIHGFPSGTAVEEKGLYTLTVTDAAYNSSTVTFTMNERVVDKSELDSLIMTAREKYDRAVEGILTGQFIPGTVERYKEALLTGLLEAESILNNYRTTQERVNAMGAVLRSATELFDNSRINGSTGDSNGDGEINISDLTLAANNYGKLSDAPDLNTVDIDRDGIIGMIDLMFIAKKIIL